MTVVGSLEMVISQHFCWVLYCDCLLIDCSIDWRVCVTMYLWDGEVSGLESERGKGEIVYCQPVQFGGELVMMLMGVYVCVL